MSIRGETRRIAREQNDRMRKLDAGAAVVMRYVPIVMVCVAVGALAQSGPYNNPDVVENPGGPSAQVLLYPGGQYGRVVRSDLREPGDTEAPIKLHMPGTHKPHAALRNPVAAVPSAPARAPRFARAPEPQPVTPPVKKPVKPSVPPPEPAPVKKVAVASPPKPVQSKPSSAGTVNLDVAVAHPVQHAAPMPQHTPAPVRMPPPPKDTKVARLEPSRSAADTIAARRGSVVFERNASDPRSSSMQSIGKLADSLGGALSDGTSRVQIFAYAGPKGDKSSDSRRLSLKRALIVRQLLIDGGVPSDRIDVRAMGGATDAGNPERVDIFLK